MSHTTTPRLTIGLPVYNGANYLREALDSLVTQTYEDFELIISDNASTDDTQAICEEYADKEDRIRYVRQAVNHGAAKNYNKTYELARGELFKWAAHDDICLPQFLERCVNALDAAGDIAVLAYTPAVTIDENAQPIVPDPYANGDWLEPRGSHAAGRLVHTLRRVNMVNSVFGVIRTEQLARTRLIDAFVASDYVLTAELAMLGRYVRLDEPLLHRRKHPEGSRHANKKLAEVATWFAGEQRRRPIMPTNVRLTFEYIKSASRIDLPVLARIGCASVIVPTMLERRARVAAGRWKRQLVSASSNG